MKKELARAAGWIACKDKNNFLLLFANYKQAG
jgi:hypothetical protein